MIAAFYVSLYKSRIMKFLRVSGNGGPAGSGGDVQFLSRCE